MAYLKDTTIKIELVRGEESRRLLQNEAFLAEWRRLLAACPWGTTFQSPDFVRVWYRVYGQHFTPLLVLQRGDSGELQGLFTLALSTDGHRLVHAGAHQAEYHVWLSTPGHGDSFPESAFDALAKAYPGKRITLLFLPPGSPTHWVTGNERWARMSELRPILRPLMAVGEGSECAITLRSRKYRARLNRMARDGEVRFVRMEGRAQLHALMEQIINFSDLRQGATNNVLPFQQDPLKKEFYLELMDAPGILHATALLVGEQVAAVQINVQSGSQIVLGVITHSPFLAKHSPGTFHILLLGDFIGAEGFSHVDLTPGGGYKERFASGHDEAFVLDLFLSRSGIVLHSIRQFAARQAKHLLGHLGIKSSGARALIGRYTTRGRSLLSPTTILISLKRRVKRFFLGERVEYLIMRLAASGAALLHRSSAMNVNSISDVLLYPGPQRDFPLSRQEFLANALRRYESGQRSYTSELNDRLAHISWLIPSTETIGTDFGQSIEVPKGSANIWEAYTFSFARGQGLQKASLAQRVCDAVSNPEVQWIYVGVRADNTVSRNNLERFGFRVCGSTWRWSRFGRTIVSGYEQP